MTEPEPSQRPAVRIVCLDPAGRILLLNWRDPASGADIWEPPGGGVESGETPFEAAGRELEEETGLPAASVRDVSIPVDREFRWLGVRYRKIEPFYLARFEETPEVAPSGFTAEEDETYLGHRWFSPEEIQTLDGLEPPDLLKAVSRLLTSG
ncbi:NUDIX hydrolase [Spirillospora sp. CA-294931]|uniref:NUDIX hydrolase n=1 Tax=Spirillospora sp. CA-294931 TaxID=3240042 RepID=UPI003D8AC70C